MHNNKGVTLTEMVIVVAIIGILAAIAIPSYVGQQKRAARNEAYANLENLRLLEEQFYAENGEYAPGDKTSGGTIYYKAGDTTISSYLPRFQPGTPGNLSFEYEIVYNVSNSSTSAFTARAVGRTGTRVSNDTFWITNNNDRNF